MNDNFEMVDTFPFRPTDVETHSTTFGIILCTGRNCLGCNSENVCLQGGIEGVEVDQVDFEKDANQEENSEIKTWIMNPVMLTKRPLGAGGITRGLVEAREENKNFVETNSCFPSAMKSHSTSNKESFDSDALGQFSRSLQRNSSKESLHRQHLGEDRQESELNNNDFDKSIERLQRYSNPQQNMIERGTDMIRRHSDSQGKMTERDKEKLPRDSDSQEKTVQRKIENRTLEVLDSSVDFVNKSAPMLNSDTVHCIRFRRNISSLDLKITDIGYALEDQLGTTVNVLEIEKRSGGWRFWVKGENTRDELLRDGLLVGLCLHRLEEVNVAMSPQDYFFIESNTQHSYP